MFINVYFSCFINSDEFFVDKKFYKNMNFFYFLLADIKIICNFAEIYTL